MDRADLHLGKAFQQMLQKRRLIRIRRFVECLPDPSVQTNLHLCSRFPGKGDHDDLLRRNVERLVAQHVKRPVHRQVCFPGAGAGGNQEVGVEITLAEPFPVRLVHGEQFFIRHSLLHLRSGNQDGSCRPESPNRYR